MNDFRHTVLCVDDEKNILNALKRLLRKEDFQLLTSSSGKEGLEILSQHDVHVVISDQRMPEMSGTDFLRQVKERYPQIIRIILTGYTDVDTITESINEGHIYKFFLKPWNDQHLTLEIRQALEQYDLIEANKRLHDMTIKQNEELKVINENLESIVADRTQSLEVQNQALQLSHAVLEDLPMPILGISSEMMIVLVNNAAQKQFAAENVIGVGNHVADYFEASLEAQINATLSSSHSQKAAGKGKKSGKPYSLELIPLSGRFSGSGIIMTIDH